MSEKDGVYGAPGQLNPEFVRIRNDPQLWAIYNMGRNDAFIEVNRESYRRTPANATAPQRGEELEDAILRLKQNAVSFGACQVQMELPTLKRHMANAERDIRKLFNVAPALSSTDQRNWRVIELEATLSAVLHTIKHGPKGSIGAVDNTFLPQIPVVWVDQWWKVLKGEREHGAFEAMGERELRFPNHPIIPRKDAKFHE